ncbi:unnamed protein product (macronuclear) [Paramecium tetraurelia]|uniref:Plus3 domain-containing protein n=1 Tax=Paramecium tetraurelia TaxID=5888 RepID=A0E506_PARTE|nr:uncharacterized protein GSPATT00023550001 [Paramecium tetraurelia]CAK90373.1 unnamed protein product [Paramecium tetraurelia]|eukprot:XP_001457770.1 hypothetical protein (macronuclear) [Paramecium tetraurelia strain d4-2]
MSKQQNLLYDFNEMTPAQQAMFLRARNELEKEKAWAEIRKQKEEEEYKRSILLSNSQTQNPQNQKVNLEKISSDSESSDSLQSENEFQKEEPQFEQKVEEKPMIVEPNNEQLDTYFKLIQNAQLKRDQIYYLLMKHYCDNVIEGSFVKINEPNLIRRKDQSYAIAQVLAVVEGEKSYQLEQTQTYKLLKLQFGEVKDAKLRHITLISNQQIQKQEFAVWQKRCEENGIQIPSKEYLQRKERDIIKSTSKLTDDQIKERINHNLTKWIQNPKSNIHFRDLPVYQNFIKNLISTNRSIIEQGEEFIADLQDPGEGETEKKQLKQEETSKILRYQRQNREKAEENVHLNEELKKIEQLLKQFKETQSQKVEPPKRQPQQVEQQQVVKQSKQIAKFSINHDYQKQLDSKYIRQYPNIKTIDGSEQFKAKILNMHSRELPIDNIIDKMMVLE